MIQLILDGMSHYLVSVHYSDYPLNGFFGVIYEDDLTPLSLISLKHLLAPTQT